MGLAFRYSQLHEVSYSRFRNLLLLPDVYLKSPSLVPSLHRYLHARYPEVDQPTADVEFNVCHHLFDLGFFHGHCVHSNVNSILPLPKRKAQKFKISNTEHAHNFALFHVHLEFQLPLKYLCVLSRSFCASFGPFASTTISSAYLITGTSLFPIPLPYLFKQMLASNGDSG